MLRSTMSRTRRANSKELAMTDTNIDTNIDTRYPSESQLVIDPLACKRAIKVLATIKPLGRNKVVRGGVSQSIFDLALVTLKDGWLELKSTNGERCARVTIGRTNDTASSWAIMATTKEITDWLKDAKASSITSAVISNTKLIVTSGGLTRDIGMSGRSTKELDLYEPLAGDRGDSGVELDLPWDIVPNVALVAGDDSTLPGLTGVRVEWTTGDDGVTVLDAIAATDRYRLHACEISGGYPGSYSRPGVSGGASIPAKWLMAVSKLPVGTLYVTDRWAVVEEKNREALGGFGFQLASRVIDSEFPRWRALLPVNTYGQYPLTFDAATMRDTIKPFTKSCGPTDHIILDLDAKTISVRDGSIIAPITYDLGDDMPTVSGWNPRYLLSALDGLEGPVTMTSSAPMKPAILTSPSSPVTRLVMPIRTT